MAPQGVYPSFYQTAPAFFQPPPPIIQPVPLVLIDPAQISQLSEGDTRQYIGEQVYPFIEQLYKDDASKLTGMLLSSRSIPDLLSYCANRDVFFGVMKQAFEALEQSRQVDVTAQKTTQ
jgi:hypothetical protein